MTTEQPFEQPADQPIPQLPPLPREQPIPPFPPLPREQPLGHRLRRRTSDRVIGGVAGGLGDYLNVDPILLRAAFAGLMIFGGAGLFLYVIGWILIPAAGRDDSVAEAAIRRVTGGYGRIWAAILVVIGVVILSPGITGYGGAIYIEPVVFWALAIALIGILLLLPREGRGAAGVAPFGPPASVEASAGSAGASTWTGGQRIPDAVPTPVVRIRERSPLGWYIIAGILVGLGVLAAVDTAAGIRVLPGQYFGAGLLTLGVGLIIGSWWGRARLMILLGLVVLPVAAVSAFLTVPLDGGFGDNYYQPRNLAEVPAAYRIAGGQLSIDLTHLGAGDAPVTLAASVGIGDLFVVVPKDATVRVTGSVQGGRLMILGREHVGTGLSDRVSDAGRPAGLTLVLTLDAGIGEVWIERSTTEGNQ